MSTLFDIAGIAISTIGTASELFGTYRDLTNWDEKDIEVDAEWLDLALQKGVLDGKVGDYSWPAERRVPTLELKGEHAVVIAINKDKRLKYRIVRGQLGSAGGRSILVRRVT